STTSKPSLTSRVPVPAHSVTPRIELSTTAGITTPPVSTSLPPGDSLLRPRVRAKAATATTPTNTAVPSENSTHQVVAVRDASFPAGSSASEPQPATVSVTATPPTTRRPLREGIAQALQVGL